MTVPVILHGTGTEARAAAEFFSGREELACFDDNGGQLEGLRALTAEEVTSLVPGAIYLRSPGIPPSNSIVTLAARSASVATTPTGYWLANYAPAGTVTVTGTKGKSTTTALTALLFREAGLKSKAYGNIGVPPLARNLPRETYPVVEISSYMAHDLPMADHLHVVTCLFRDHLPWHGGEAAYHEAKLRPFRMGARGFAPRSVVEAHGLGTSVRPFESVVTETFEVGGKAVDLGAEELGFRSGPLRAALAAAVAAGSAFLEAPKLRAATERALRSWPGLPSRQAIVASHDGRLWVDDALATIPEASLAVLKRFASRPVTLLIGGLDRGQVFDELARYFDEVTDVRAVAFGPVSERIAFAERVAGFEEAIDRAVELTPKSGVVLFSPAAPSAPPFRNWEERAAFFAKKAAAAH